MGIISTIFAIPSRQFFIVKPFLILNGFNWDESDIISNQSKRINRIYNLLTFGASVGVFLITSYLKT